MTSQVEIKNMALFCDFENIALGVKDAKYARFDIQKVLERLLLKGSIAVKKAYCDWERYKEFKGVIENAVADRISQEEIDRQLDEYADDVGDSDDSPDNNLDLGPIFGG